MILRIAKSASNCYSDYDKPMTNHNRQFCEEIAKPKIVN